METLVLFAKPPEAGKVKTRLASGLGESAAVHLYRSFLHDSLALTERWCQTKVAADYNRRVVLYASEEDPFFRDLVQTSGVQLAVQEGEDLGERMAHCLETEFAHGAKAVCIIGADTPALPLAYLNEAFRALHWEDVVLGPTFDGGYWLVGAQQRVPEIFTGILWSSNSVMKDSVQKAIEEGYRLQILPFWYDIDTAEDLATLRWQLLHAESQKREICAATALALEELKGSVNDGMTKMEEQGLS